VTGDRTLRTTFDDVAALYDEARPGYPEPLIEDALSLSGIPPDGRILEIGCGSGQATLPFARRGYWMLCLELGPNLAALAAGHCRPYPGVEVQNVAFEDWPLQAGAFDLVISAGAFDWIAPEVAYPKAAAALADTGAIALFWNDHRGGDTAFFRATRDLRRRIVPHLAGATDQKPLDALEAETVEQIQASGPFGPVVARRYPWTATHTADQYVKLISTYSMVQGLPEGIRRDLLAGIRELAEQYGGTVESRYVAMLYVARVSRSRSNAPGGA
jgi:SAM-dependent methyltransferase